MTDTLQSVRAETPTLLSIVYSSAATVPFEDVDLAALLAVSRMNNERRGLTGLLLFRDGQFMQVLEGPEAAVRRALATIAADPRHTGVWTLDEETIEHRRFGAWSMGYRPLADGELTAWFGSAETGAPEAGSRAAVLLEWFRNR